MNRHHITVHVLGPWSLTTSCTFWEGFAPATLTPQGDADELHTVFRVEGDWHRAEVTVTQDRDTAQISVAGCGDLEAAARQTIRFLSLDVDARAWPDVAQQDPVIADAQKHLPGLRPCGFHSPYEAATWAVLSQRIRITQAARLRKDLITHHGDNQAFPSPQVLRGLNLDLPGRKTEYLHAVAEAALEGRLDGAALRSLDPEAAVRVVQQIKGLGPFAADLVIVRGANAPDALPRHERRLEAEIIDRYGPNQQLADIAEKWRPFRAWAAVHLRTLREQRTHEINGHSQ